METWFWYILKSAACLSFFYVLYLAIFRKDTNFQLLRLYLLSAILLSLILPLNKVSFGLPVLHSHADKTETRNIPVAKTMPVAAPAIEEGVKTPADAVSNPSAITDERGIDGSMLLQIIYLAIAGFLFLRPVLAILKIWLLIIHSSKVYRGGKPFYYSEQINSSFSFFSYVFVSRDLQYKPELEKILIHENIHVAQYHTLDLMLVELLSAVMWFNPVVWMLRKTLQQLHEYLADEGVLDTGFDRREYQALLLNHAAEDRLILSSSFNQSLIKKRIVMMTNRNMNSGTKLKILALIPITVVLFLGISCTNEPSPKVAAPTPPTKKQTVQPERLEITSTTATKEPEHEKPSNVTEVVSWETPTLTNVLYIGIPIPLNISVSGVDDSKIAFSIDNGSITRDGKSLIVRVTKTNRATIVIYKMPDKGDIFDPKNILGKKTFVVKHLPNPVANIDGLSGRDIEKDKLLAGYGLTAQLVDFDFDAKFKVVEFKLSAFLHGFEQIGLSNSNAFTKGQKDLISNLNHGDHILFYDITAIGPDGVPRDLAPIRLTIQ